MDLMWIMIIFIIVVMVAFFITVLLLPEWVGITGKKAREIMEHQAEKPADAKGDADSRDQAP